MSEASVIGLWLLVQAAKVALAVFVIRTLWRAYRATHHQEPKDGDDA